MKVKKLHPWDITPQMAVELQKKLAEQLQFIPFKKNLTLAAGADISYSKGDDTLYAAVVVLKIPTFEIVEVASAVGKASFPYLTGLLAFRELPVLLQAFEKLKTIPDVVLCDGQGIAHPRKLGLASHLGLLLDLPTIGCAKSRLVGEFAPLGESRWARSPLLYHDQVVGVVLRTKARVRPMYISPGHKINFESSIEIVKQTVSRFRLPETTKAAHLIVNEMRRTNPSLLDR